MNEFQDKVAVITGAGRGIGRGIALRCAQEGMKVVLAGIGMDSLAKTNADIEALGIKTLVIQTDVSELGEVQQLAEQSFRTFGTVDLLVNNAGVASPGSVLESSMDDWNWVMNVNFNGVLYGVKTFVPRMIEQAAGHVVNVSSISGILPGGGSYGVSKHAVLVLTEALYNDLATAAPHINVSAFCPGWVSSEFYRVEESRPERYQAEATAVSAERRANWKKSIESGISIDEAADMLFEGIRNDKLYIGPKGFLDQIPNLHAVARSRVDNILKEKNPNVPL